MTRAGCAVAVLEGRRVGSGTTGNTTATVSLMQGRRLSAIGRQHLKETVQRCRRRLPAELSGSAQRNGFPRIDIGHPIGEAALFHLATKVGQW